MESGIQSSFIPHDAGQPQQVRRKGAGGIGDLFLILGIVALAASAALGAAVFLYMQYLQSTVNSDIAQLKKAEQEFQPALVQQLTRLDDRMNAAQTLLTSHLAPSALFDVLNQVTLQTISYSTLDLEVTDATHLKVKMAGIAQSVNSIALQNDLMSQSGIFTSPIFSGIDRQKDGVHFNVTALINPAGLSFTQLTGGGAQGQPPQGQGIPGAQGTPPAAQGAAPQNPAASTTPQ